MKRGICKLCLVDKPLCNSHLMPRVLYEHCRDGAGHPVRVGDGYVIPTSRQTTFSLLCADCEDILNKGGERWVCPKLIWPDRMFELFDMLTGTCVWNEEAGGLYWTKSNPAFAFQKITRFAMGIFWKASAHSWKKSRTAPHIELECGETLRTWLRGESELPRNLTLSVTLSRPQDAHITFNAPVESPPSSCRTYTFHALGAHFTLRIGEMPLEMKLLCFYRNPMHPVLVSDGITQIITVRQAQQFAESRKTRAYERSKGIKKKPQ